MALVQSIGAVSHQSKNYCNFMSTVKFISSSQNQDYKYWLSLAKHKQAKNDDLIIIEGEHLCSAWLEHKGQPEYLIIDENLHNSGRFNDLWVGCVNSKKIVLSANLTNAMTQVKHGIGLFFVVKKPYFDLPEKFDQNIVCLDRVQDPGNLGTLLRTTAAAGISQVLLSNGCAGAWSPKVLRSAQGAHFALAIYESIDLHMILSKSNINVCCTSLDQSQDLYKLDLTGDVAWIFGNEGQGVAKSLVDICNTKVKIPQSDQVESLNVAAAAAVCLFEQRRQRLIQ